MLNPSLFQNLGKIWLWVPACVKGDVLSTQHPQKPGCQFVFLTVGSCSWGFLPCTSPSAAGGNTKKELLLPLNLGGDWREKTQITSAVTSEVHLPFSALLPPGLESLVFMRVFSCFGQPAWQRDRLAEEWCWGPMVRVPAVAGRLHILGCRFPAAWDLIEVDLGYMKNSCYCLLCTLFFLLPFFSSFPSCLCFFLPHYSHPSLKWEEKS